MLVGYLGPEGTFTQEALLASGLPEGGEARPLPTVYDTVMAVHEGSVQRALVPIENSLEGSVNDTLDTLAGDATDVRIVGEVVHPITQCLIAREGLDPGDVETVVSMPQASAQCARFLRAHLPGAAIVPANSTADAVRTVAESENPWAALGTALSAQLYGCVVLQQGVEDVAGNETRFVWLARRGENEDAERDGGAAKTSVVFWGPGDDSPGWLVRCLSEFAFRGVNLSMIESRPRRLSLGHYMFFVDLEGGGDDPEVAAAIEALGQHAETVRVLGSYSAA
jgi:prephenate dehydratase